MRGTTTQPAPTTTPYIDAFGNEYLLEFGLHVYNATSARLNSFLTLFNEMTNDTQSAQTQMTFESLTRQTVPTCESNVQGECSFVPHFRSLIYWRLGVEMQINALNLCLVAIHSWSAREWKKAKSFYFFVSSINKRKNVYYSNIISIHISAENGLE